MDSVRRPMAIATAVQRWPTRWRRRASPERYGTESCKKPIRTQNGRAKSGEGMPMLRSLKELEHYAVSATDGDIEVLRIFSWTMSAG